MISIDCEGSIDCQLGVEFCEACKQNALEQGIDHAMMQAEDSED